MFEIQYNSTNLIVHASDVNEMSLRYSLFLGDIILRTDEERIEMQWGWIPLLDFAYSLLTLCDKLLNDKSLVEVYEFTESEGALVFEMRKGYINIRTTFSDEKVRVKKQAFKRGVYEFYSEMIAQIKINNESIIGRPEFGKYDMEIGEES